MLVREIICLIEGGFADGALGRWRLLDSHLERPLMMETGTAAVLEDDGGTRQGGSIG